MSRLPSALIAALTGAVVVTGCGGHAAQPSRQAAPTPSSPSPTPPRVTIGIETRVDTAVDEFLRRTAALAGKHSLDAFLSLKEACADALAAITAALAETDHLTPVRPEYDHTFAQNMSALFDAVDACKTGGATAATIDRDRSELLAALRLLYG